MYVGLTRINAIYYFLYGLSFSSIKKKKAKPLQRVHRQCMAVVSASIQSYMVQCLVLVE